MARDFSAELLAAREAGDWVAHARIWEERRIGSVEADEEALGASVPIRPLSRSVPRNLFVLVRHDADNENVTCERGARRTMPTPTPRGVTGTSMVAAEAFLAEWGIQAEALDLARVPSKETRAQPYVVRVRCVRA